MKFNGAPRITAELTECYRISLNRKTVAKRMRMMSTEGISPITLLAVPPQGTEGS